MEKNPENSTPLAKAMLVPALTEEEIKVALGEDEVTTFSFSYALCSSIVTIKSLIHPCVLHSFKLVKLGGLQVCSKKWNPC